MTQGKSRALWWKLTEGRLVANKSGIDLDGSTQALVHDLVEFETASKALKEKVISDAPTMRLEEVPLPFEAIHVWITWTMAGSKINH
ncbi:MAG: hypothetical protein LAO31_17525 [Acidobacteriia bacterium]|nr:hypothetical protein [Terriglobia bacterium]